MDTPPPSEVEEIKTPSWFTNTEKAEVSVIVPMYKSGAVIKEQIQSWDLQNSGLKVEVIYADDCCPHHSKDIVVQKWLERKPAKPIGKILHHNQNQGFGPTCNAGARFATSDYLIFLNSDTTVTQGWIRPIIRLLNKDGVGIVGNLQLSRQRDREIIESAGSEWNWQSSTFLHIGRNSYDGKIISNPFHTTNCPTDIQAVQEREMVTGACLAIRKELFDEIGGFNTNYRIGYWEDSEMCMVVREKGYRIMYQPNSVIYHKGGHSGSGGHKYHKHNQRFFFNKWVASGRIDKLVKAKRSDSPEVANIVLQRQAAHGDVLIASAVAPALKQRYPDCKITFVTLCPEILEGNPWIDNITERANLVDRHGHLYFNLDMAYEYRPKTNILEAYADLVGVKTEDCKLFLQTNSVEGLPEKYTVFHAGHTSWVGRNWSPMKFEILANKLRAEGHKIVCVGTLADPRVGCDLDLRGKTNIAQLAHVIKNASQFVGIDSFPMHIAQTFDVPGVCFFGSIHPHTRLISSKMLPVVAQGVGCLGCHHRQPTPCVATTFCETQFLDCINLVTVDHMLKKIKELEAIKDR